MSKINCTIGFIGAGNMAQAIGFRLLNQGAIEPSNITVSAPSDRNLKLWDQKGARTTSDNVIVVRNSEIIFIAVKPQYFEKSIESLFQEENGNIDEVIRDKKIFVSVMAGKKISYISKILNKFEKNLINYHVLRVMPNTPCSVGEGYSVLCCHPDESIDLTQILEIMTFTGTCDIIPESMFDAISAVSGSGPAYIYMMIESLADGAVRCGIPRNFAMKAAAQTVIGAGKMVLEAGKHPGQLKDEVCSPAGTTISAVHELEKGGFRGIVMNAVVAASNRSTELSINVVK